MKNNKTTIKEIAEEVGMSASSVSRALSDYSHTSEETKRKVKEAAEKLGYRHNALAAALRNSKSRTIGLIVPKISMYFQAAVITAIQNKLHDFGYTVIICQSNESPELEKKLVELLYASRVEGIIISSSINTVDFSHFKTTLGNEIPLVFYDRVPEGFPAHMIRSDDYKGAFGATSHLIAQGCKRIVHIGGNLICSIYKDRYEGYQDALTKNGIKLEEELVYFHELTWENALNSCRKIFNNSKFPDGIFSSNDTTALAVIQFAKENNIRVPEDLKVVGYSNDNRANISFPTITSVEQFPHKMGEKAAVLIMDILLGKIKPGNKFITHTMEPTLIERGSTAISL